MGINVGFEQDGKGEDFLRPVVVFKKFSKDSFLGIPLTSMQKNGRFYQSFKLAERDNTAILSQVRLYDAQRLAYKMGRMSVGDYKLVKQKLIALLQ